MRGPRLRARRLHGRAAPPGAWTATPSSPSPPRRLAVADSGLPIDDDGAGIGAIIGNGGSGARLARGAAPRDAGARPGPGVALRDPPERGQHGRRPGVDRARAARPGHGHLHRLRGRHRRDRHRRRDHPPRRRPGDARRRRRHPDLPVLRRRLRRDARALAPQRRPGRRGAAVRPGPRRVPGRRGGRGGGAGAPRGRAWRAAREIICEVAGYGASADGHHITDPDPGASQARAVRMALDDAGLAAGRRRPRERPRRRQPDRRPQPRCGCSRSRWARTSPPASP